jgi:hypothetical protein
VARVLLTGLALILIGTLLGVLASRFLPSMTGNVVAPAILQPEVSVTPPVMTPTTVITPIPAPTATPSALLNLKWNMMTVKSPITPEMSFRLYYPTTWSIKTYQNTKGVAGKTVSKLNLILTKGTSVMSIIEVPDSPSNVCSYSTPDSYMEILNPSVKWRTSFSEEAGQRTYTVCGETSNSVFSSPTSIGSISLLAPIEDTQTIDEFHYILQKIVIIK